jgi:single-strand DNA-binding protein
MPNFNKVIVVGHLGRDAELKYTPSGAAVASLSLAVTKKWKDKDDQQQERTNWFRVSVWGKTAESRADYLKKGKAILVEGQLETREWEKDGQKRTSTEIRADKVVLLGGGKREESDRAATGTSNFPEDDIPF